MQHSFDMDERSRANGPANRGEEARRRLIEAGLRIFGRYGYEAASTRQLAEKAGVNLSAITYHFGNKEGLYLAVVSDIAARMGAPLTPVQDRVGEALQQIDSLTPPECLDLLQTLLDALAHRLMSVGQDEASSIVLIWIREQIDPTAAFDILYGKVMERMLGPCSLLIGRLLNKPADDPECRIRVFALVGQVVFFRLARQAVLRTLDWADYDAERTTLIRSIVWQQSLEGLNALRDSATPGDKAPDTIQ